MPSIIETTVFKFDELSDAAKEKARDWWRQASIHDHWYEYTFEDVTECGACFGITVKDIHFSGFSSQGDGACFTGSYAYRKGGVAEVSAHTGGCETLVNIATRLQEIQRKAFYRVVATVNHRGHYYHEYCTDIEVDTVDGAAFRTETDSEITECLRDFMRWTYRELERAYDDYMSNEQVDESIIMNDYTFTIEGRRFG